MYSMHAPQTPPLAPTPPVMAAMSTVHSASHSGAHGTAHSAVHSTTHGPPVEEDEEVPALCCAVCGSAIVTRDELLLDRAETPRSAVYAYELDVLEEEVWAYSATNPQAARYDVIRTKPAKSVIAYGDPTLEHSWFVPLNPNP